MATQKTREQELAEEFKDGLDKDSAVLIALERDDAKAKVGELETAVSDLTAERDKAPPLFAELEGKVSELTQQRNDLQTAFDAEAADWAKQRDSLLEDAAKALEARDVAEKRATEADGAVALVEALKKGMEELGYPEEGGPEDATAADKAVMALRGVRADRDELREQLAEANAKIAAVETKAKSRVSKGERAPTLRKVGPIKDGDGLSGDALTAAIEKADKVEIVVSDGKKEIDGVDPIVVEGDVWREHSLGRMLRDPVEIHGPANGGSSFAIDGYGLLLDGKQVAYTKRSDAINVAPGSTVSLSNDIYF